MQEGATRTAIHNFASLRELNRVLINVDGPCVWMTAFCFFLKKELTQPLDDMRRPDVQHDGQKSLPRLSNIHVTLLRVD
jgi:hypothetical protein